MSATTAETMPQQPRAASAEEKIATLKQMLLEIADLGSANAVLSWDHAVFMPPGGAPARARQGALLSRLAHERRTAPALGRLIDDLRVHAETLPPDADDACLIRVAARDFDRATRVPAAFVERQATLGSIAYETWTQARPANDFAKVAPLLEQTLDLSREYAGFFAPYGHIADPMVDDADRGMTVASIRHLFTELRRELVPIVKAITAQQEADVSCLHGSFPESPQVAFGLSIAQRFGYDLARGRLDKSPHPFCTTFSRDDVRITTRVDTQRLDEALFSTLHESGHALYEMGVDPALSGTPLGGGVSAGVHESQSRLWENIVGRSRPFWEHVFPRLRDTFPDALGGVSVETFYRAINRVCRSLIRTDADEVTYNLHVMLRFDLESDLLEGRLAVKDIPDAWNARMQDDLGVTPPDNRDGCLQDVHWFCGSIGGAFQGYTIGNVLSAQFYDAAVKAHSTIHDEIASGRFASLHGWLRQNLYRHGSKFTPDEVVLRATGRPMSTEPYLAYLRGKYGALYDLSPQGTH